MVKNVINQHSHTITYRGTEHNNTTVVENALIISLERSDLDRYQPMLERIKAIPELNFQKIEAIDGKSIAHNPTPMQINTYGCLLSHIKAICHAQDNNWPCVLILEDDVEFADNFYEKLKTYMLSLPDNWNGLYLGGKDTIPTGPHNDLLRRCSRTWGAYGYILRSNCYKRFIKEMSERKIPCDTYYTFMQPSMMFFKTKEPLVKHIAGWSVRREYRTTR